MTRTERQDVSGEIRQVYLELSTRCNLACKTCVRHPILTFKPEHMTLKTLKRLLPMLEELESLERIVLLGFGEALCHPKIREMLTLLRRVNTRLLLVTNATFLTDAMNDLLVSLPLDDLFISWDDDIDGGGDRIRQGARAEIFRRNAENLMNRIAARGSGKPSVGLEIVATRRNSRHIEKTVRYGYSLGIRRFIITNLFPYTREMEEDILYTMGEGKAVKIKDIIRSPGKDADLSLANWDGSGPRLCPFMERGTLFVKSSGEAAPCPELAYDHRAIYFGVERLHRAYSPGHTGRMSLREIWEVPEFVRLRQDFYYYEFPDCSSCHNPGRCYHRTEENGDCYNHTTPCGECLWAKNIVLCP